MITKAGRFPLRLWRGLSRPALLMLALVAPLKGMAEIARASFADPTSRYAHGVLGDDIEYGAIELVLQDGAQLKLTLPPSRVFEDIAPRLWDLDKDGLPEVVVVESHRDFGARLSVYSETGLVTATPYIGQSYRWLAPVGAADMDGDGFIELAYIDRPHLAKILRIWRFSNNTLTEIAALAGHTNHRIGWDFVVGGIRYCEGLPEIITASADWSTVQSTSFNSDAKLQTQMIAPYSGTQSLDAALNCF